MDEGAGMPAHKRTVSKDTLCDIVDRCRDAGGVLHVREVATEMYEIWYEAEGEDIDGKP